MMTSYEVLKESVTPCGGEHYAIREFFELETDDPLQWVAENGRFPVLESNLTEKGDLRIITGNAAGYRDTFTFTP